MKAPTLHAVWLNRLFEVFFVSATLRSSSSTQAFRNSRRHLVEQKYKSAWPPRVSSTISTWASVPESWPRPPLCAPCQMNRINPSKSSDIVPDRFARFVIKMAPKLMIAMECGSNTFALLQTGQSASLGKKVSRPLATGNLNFIIFYVFLRTKNSPARGRNGAQARNSRFIAKLLRVW